VGLPTENGNHESPPPRANHPSGNAGHAPWPSFSNGVERMASARVPIASNQQTPRKAFPFRRNYRTGSAVSTIREHGGSGVGNGDVVVDRGTGQLVEKEELRELGDLIRERYRLDMLLYNLRDKTSYEDDVIDENIIKASAALAKIKRLVDSFDRPDLFKDRQDHEKLKEIRMRIYEGGKRDWKKQPPSMDRGFERGFERRAQKHSPMSFDLDDDFD